MLKLPISYNDLKLTLRKGLNQELRTLWWPMLPLLEENQEITSYPDVEETANRLCDIIKLKFNDHRDHDVSQALVERDIVDNHMLISYLENVIFSAVQKKNLCYLMLSHLLGNATKFVVRDEASIGRRIHAYRVLLSHYMPKTYTCLNNIGALDDKYLNMIFIEYFSTIFPLHMTQRIMDSFLLEGIKIIFRYGLALIRMHKHIIKSKRFTTGDMFWDYITTTSLSPDAEVQLYQYAYDEDRHPVTKARRPMKIGRSQLASITSEAAVIMQPYSSDIYVPSHLSAKYSTKATSPAQDVKIPSSSSSLPSNHATVRDTMNLARLSALLTDKLSDDIYSFLPDSLKFETFELVFTSSSHGYNMDTMYSLCEKKKPCIILIKGANSSTVVGAFISSPISPPSHVVRGDGLTICFRLDDTGSICHRWIGLKSDDMNDKLLSSAPAATPSAVELVKLQYAVFDRQYFAFGGSLAHGSNALRVDGDMKACTCSYSDTFDNEPMINNGKPFDIATIEVLCGR